MNKFKAVGSRKLDWMIAGVLAVISACLYCLSLADYAFPGEGARLMVLWRGLDTTVVTPRPLMAFFGKLCGGSNLLAPVCGVLSVVAIYHLMAFFVRERIHGEFFRAYATPMSRIAGVFAAVLFMFAPAVREASTHLSSYSFDAAWGLLTLTLLIPYARAGKGLSSLGPLLMGAMTGLGLADSPLFLFFAIGAGVGIWAVAVRRGQKGYGAALLFLMALLVTFFVYAPAVSGDFPEAMRALFKEGRGWFRIEGWILVAIFVVLPFVISIFSSASAYNLESGLALWLYHLVMSFAVIIAQATPLAPSALMRSSGILPVGPCAISAMTAAYLVSYWGLLWVAKVRRNESVDQGPVAQKGRPLARVVLPVLLAVFALTVMINLFSFDGSRGAFADRTAEKVIQDLGDRNWFVTDGLLDDHLRLAAAKFDKEKELNLICLQRDLDERYLQELGKTVEAKRLGGEKNRDLILSLSLGVLPFVQDWFAMDKEIADKVAIFGAPDLWYSAGLKAVPEFLFFGADEARQPDWSAWDEFDQILKAPKGWGSYRLWKEQDPVEMMRLRLRRHLGLVANNRGIFLQDRGDEAGAYELYNLVLTEIDADNICALFNEFELARTGYAKAAAKKKELERALKAIVEDKNRRYVLWKLANCYGYIRSPEIFIRLGFAWARSGRPGDALSQIRRAIDIIPTDRRSSLLNMMAALYASNSEGKRSRDIYEGVLAKDENNHDALMGLMRIELMDGNSEKAIDYLARATKAAGDDPRARLELAMLHLMRNELTEARSILTKAADAERENLQIWSLLAAVVMQQCDAAKDEAAKRKFTKELETWILPEMEKRAQDPTDYYVQTTKAFVLMRQGAEKRREARDAFVIAAKTRPDVQATQDLVLGLDISLNDVAEAERHARDVLRRNRNAPLANYVMGSLALQQGRLDEAEMYLKRSANAPRPVVLAQNDLAEVYRRTKRFTEAENYARAAVRANPKLYVAWETLGATLMDANGDLNEAEECVQKACELSKGKAGSETDIRMLISLARVQIAKGDKLHGKATIRKVQSRVKELSDYERAEFEELQKSVR